MLLVLAKVIAAGAAFNCTPTAVWDGDGPIWCAEGPKIRLAGIAAREIDGACKRGHPCPSASGIVARDGLVRLLGGPKGKLPTGHVKVATAPLSCRSQGGAGGSRTAAWCVTASGVDLSCELVSAKVVVRWPKYWQQHACRK